MSDATPLLDRRGASALLHENGFPIAVTTLETLASRGGGPEFRRFGRRCLYERAALMAWARSKLSEPVASTSTKAAA